MVVAMQDIHTDQLRAVQCTAFDRTGNKIGRRMRGVAAGCAIKLSSDEDVAAGLGVAEGFETALAVMMAGWRQVWALGSAAAIEMFPPLPGIQAITIFGDHDENGVGQAAALACASHWRAAGAEATIWLPNAAGDDWNDVTMRAA